MEQPSTCGQGIARHAVLPARMSELVAAAADTLEAHMRALDPDDPTARAEHAAYERLVHTHRRIAAHLRAGAAEMTGLRDLPMAPHDMSKLGDARAIEVFKAYVHAEEQLQELLVRFLANDREMLEAMTTGIPAK
jgi:hypothetical protein